MTRIPLLLSVVVMARCGEPPDLTPSPTAPPAVTETPTETPTPSPTPEPPTQPWECPMVQPIPYCELHPEDC